MEKQVLSVQTEQKLLAFPLKPVSPLGRDLCAREPGVRNSAVSLTCTVAPWPSVRWHRIGTLTAKP